MRGDGTVTTWALPLRHSLLPVGRSEPAGGYRRF